MPIIAGILLGVMAAAAVAGVVTSAVYSSRAEKERIQSKKELAAKDHERRLERLKLEKEHQEESDAKHAHRLRQLDYREQARHALGAKRARHEDLKRYIAQIKSKTDSPNKRPYPGNAVAAAAEPEPTELPFVLAVLIALAVLV